MEINFTHLGHACAIFSLVTHKAALERVSIHAPVIS